MRAQMQEFTIGAVEVRCWVERGKFVVSANFDGHAMKRVCDREPSIHFAVGLVGGWLQERIDRATQERETFERAADAFLAGTALRRIEEEAALRNLRERPRLP